MASFNIRLGFRWINGRGLDQQGIVVIDGWHVLNGFGKLKRDFENGVGNVKGNASSEGNFLFVSQRGRAALWDQETGKWTTRDPGAFLIPIGSDPIVETSDPGS